MLKKARPYFTLDTRIGSMPRDWLVFVEPKIVREIDGTCWLWQGGIDAYGEPILAFTDPVTKKRTAVRLKVFVMKLFWDGIRGHEIIHECGNLNCVNPHHFFISTTSWRVKDRKALVKKKQNNIKQYIKYEKNRDGGL